MAMTPALFGQLVRQHDQFEGRLLVKWGPASVVIPESVPEHELAQYLDDVFHESATPARPCVLRRPS